MVSDIHKLNIDVKPAIVLGAGGHAKVVVDMLLANGITVLGFTTPEPEAKSPHVDYKVLGSDEVILDFTPQQVSLVNGIGSLPGNNLRYTVAAKMRNLGYKFRTLIHPSAIVSPDVSLAEGVLIMAGAVVQSGVEIGLDTIINTGSLIDHDCKIGFNCHVAPGVVCSGGVKVGNNVHIGTGSSVIQNISIGENSVIAAGSVLYRDIPSDIHFIQKR